jgi:hypothetical protein
VWMYVICHMDVPLAGYICCMLYVVCCMLYMLNVDTVTTRSHVTWYMLHGTWYMLHVTCCMLHATLSYVTCYVELCYMLHFAFCMLHVGERGEGREAVIMAAWLPAYAYVGAYAYT